MRLWEHDKIYDRFDNQPNECLPTVISRKEVGLLVTLKRMKTWKALGVVWKKRGDDKIILLELCVREKTR